MSWDQIVEATQVVSAFCRDLKYTSQQSLDNVGSKEPRNNNSGSDTAPHPPSIRQRISVLSSPQGETTVHQFLIIPIQHIPGFVVQRQRCLSEVWWTLLYVESTGKSADSRSAYEDDRLRHSRCPTAEVSLPDQNELYGWVWYYIWVSNVWRVSGLASIAPKNDWVE